MITSIYTTAATWKANVWPLSVGPRTLLTATGLRSGICWSVSFLTVQPQIEDSTLSTHLNEQVSLTVA